MNGVYGHRFICVAVHPTKKTNTNRRALSVANDREQIERCPSAHLYFFHCEGFSVPFSIAKPTLGGTTTPCRCQETHKKSEPLTQPPTQPTAHAATPRSHLAQPPHAAKGLTQPLLVPEVGCWSNLLTEPRLGGVTVSCGCPT